MSLWAIDPFTGSASSERMTRPVPNALSRDYLCLAFTPHSEKQWLYGGTASGDVVIGHVKSKAVYHSVFCSGGGVTALLALPAASMPAGGRTPVGTVDYGGRAAPEGGVHVIAGAGDGTVTVYHHAVSTLEADIVLSAAVSASTSASSSATRPPLAARTFVALRAVRLQGAVWSLASLAPHQCLPPSLPQWSPLRGGAGSAGSAGSSSSPPPLSLLAGTSAGYLYRLTEGPHSPVSAGSGSGGGLSAAVLRSSHASAGEALESSSSPSLALAATPGVASLPPQLMSSGLIGGVWGAAFAPGASDCVATIGGDNSVRLWDLGSYACVAITQVRGAGRASALVHAGEFHVSGWQDGSVRAYYAVPDAAAAASAGAASEAAPAGGAAFPASSSASAAAHLGGGSGSSAAGRDRFPGLGGGARSPERSGARAAVGREGWPSESWRPAEERSYNNFTGHGVIGAEERQRRGGGAEDRGHLWSIGDAHSPKEGGVTALAMASNQRFIVTGGGDAKVRVWDLRSRELVSAFSEHAGSVTALAIYRDDAHFLSASKDRSFICWDLRKERRVSSHCQRMGGINSLCLSRDQSLVLTVGQERKVQLWDLRESAPVQTISPAAGPSGEALCVASAHSKDVIVTGGSDGIVRFWDLRNGGRPMAE
jgi:WD40 repeat protein